MAVSLVCISLVANDVEYWASFQGLTCQLYIPTVSLCLSLCFLCILHIRGLHTSLQSETSFYSPIRISCWANVLGVGVQCTAFVSWSILLASSPKETLPSLYFSLHFKEFYRFLSYILLHYKFEFIFYIKIPNFQRSSLLLQRHLLREFISFLDPFTLYPKPMSYIVFISLRALEEFYLPICP